MKTKQFFNLDYLVNIDIIDAALYPTITYRSEDIALGLPAGFYNAHDLITGFTINSYTKEQVESGEFGPLIIDEHNKVFTKPNVILYFTNGNKCIRYFDNYDLANLFAEKMASFIKNRVVIDENNGFTLMI